MAVSHGWTTHGNAMNVGGGGENGQSRVFLKKAPWSLVMSYDDWVSIMAFLFITHCWLLLFIVGHHIWLLISNFDHRESLNKPVMFQQQHHEHHLFIVASPHLSDAPGAYIIIQTSARWNSTVLPAPVSFLQTKMAIKIIYIYIIRIVWANISRRCWLNKYNQIHWSHLQNGSCHPGGDDCILGPTSNKFGSGLVEKDFV